MPAPYLQLTLLGGFHVEWTSGVRADLANKKTQGLLAYLALPAGKAHSREKLMGLLWSDRAEPQARNSLRQALAELGRALGPDEPSPLVKEQDRIALDPASVEVDALVFERLAASDSFEELRRAVGLYAGDLLEGIGIRDGAFEEWLLQERQRMRNLEIGTLKKLLGLERGEEAIATARHLLALDPLQEEAHRALMRLQAAAGEIGTALRQYDTCRDTLKRELGVEPSEETEALHRRIRQKPAEAERFGGAETSSSFPPALPRIVRSGQPRPSVAVLPFVNLSADPTQQYLSDGITEDIITELSRYRELLVIARNSSFQYRDKANDMKHIGGELGVEYLVDGSLRKAGDRLRVTAQLIEAETGSHIWAERYDRNLEDVFAIQDEVTRTIATTLIGQLSRSGAERARRKPTEQWAAYEYVLQANYWTDRYDTEAAETLLKRAIAIDPNYALAYAALSYVYLQRFFDDVQAETLNLALANAETALSLDDRDESCHRAVGVALTFLEKYDLAGAHLDKALALNPNNVIAAAARANWLVRVGRPEEALQTLDEAVKRDPLHPPWFWEVRTMILFQQKRYEGVIEAINRKSPLRHWDHAFLAAAYIRLGRIDEARAESAEVLRMKPDFSIAAYAIEDPYKNPADQKHVLDAFLAAGLPK